MRDNLLEPCKRKSGLPRAYFSTQAEAIAFGPSTKGTSHTTVRSAFAGISPGLNGWCRIISGK